MKFYRSIGLMSFLLVSSVLFGMESISEDESTSDDDVARELSSETHDLSHPEYESPDNNGSSENAGWGIANFFRSQYTGAAELVDFGRNAAKDLVKVVETYRVNRALLAALGNCKNSEIARLLTQQGADPNSVLFAALLSGETHSLWMLLICKELAKAKNGLSVDINSMHGHPKVTALHAALSSSNFVSAWLLLNDPDVDPTIRGSGQVTVQIDAYEIHRLFNVKQMAKRLSAIAGGPTYSVVFENCMTSMSELINFSQACEALVEVAKRRDFPTRLPVLSEQPEKLDRGLATLIDRCIKVLNIYCVEDLIKLLAEKGALVTWQAEDGADEPCPLLNAFYGETQAEPRKSHAVVASLEDINGHDEIGFTTFMWAAARGDVDLARFLLNIPGINVNACDERGFTALHLAALNGDYAMVRFLLSIDELNTEQKTLDAHEGAFFSLVRKGVTALTLAKRRARAYTAINDTEALKRYEQIIGCFSELHQRRRALYLSLFYARGKIRGDILELNLRKRIARNLHLGEVNQESNVIESQSTIDFGG